MILVIAVLKLKVVCMPGFEPMDTVVGNQCQMAVVGPLGDSDVGMTISTMPIIVTIVGIICILMIYTLIIIIVGHRYGFRVVKYKIVKEKMTMTPVTYTAVREVLNPRFEYSRLIGGCWEFEG